MANVNLPSSQWVNIYADPGVIADGITVGTPIKVVNLTPNDVRLSSTASEPVVSDPHVPLLFGRGVGENDAADPGAWALCVSGGAINVQAQ